MNSTATTIQEIHPAIFTTITTDGFSYWQESTPKEELSPWTLRVMLGVMADQLFVSQKTAITASSIQPARQQATEITEPATNEMLGWLMLSECSFDFWDNESDAIFDTL
jgi:hypothetical protein